MTPLRAQRVLHRLRYAARDERGFTLLEAVVSFALFATVAAAAVAAIANGIKVSNTTNNRVTATNLAQGALATARASESSLIASAAPAGGTVTATSVSGQYTVTRTVTIPGTTGNLCPAGQTIPVTVQVTWTGGGGRNVRFDTVIAC